MYYRQRIYDSNTGRFASPDPLGFLDKTSLYLYVGNAPVKYTDPRGLFPYHGKYGGPNWTAGKACSWEQTTPEDRAANPPVDYDDKCYMAHDECYAKCRANSKTLNETMECFNKCDRRLRECLRGNPDKTVSNVAARSAFVCQEGIRGALIEPEPGVFFKFSF